MTSTGKIVVGIIAVLIIAAGAYYWFSHTPSGMPGNAATSTETGNSASADSMNQDVSSIDAALNGLNSDNAEIDSSLNAQ